MGKDFFLGFIEIVYYNVQWYLGISQVNIWMASQVFNSLVDYILELFIFNQGDQW